MQSSPGEGRVQLRRSDWALAFAAEQLFRNKKGGPETRTALSVSARSRA
jgi:hypothetical protein